MTTQADALILRYLQHLESQLGDLPANRRQELLDEVQEHITTARADLDPETEAGVLTLLERLGDPADIAAEARDRSGVQAQPARPATPWLEITTIVLLVIPFLGWVLGGGAGLAVAALDHPRQARRHRRRAELGPGRPGDRHGRARRRPIGQDGVDVATTGPNPLEVILVVAPFVLPLAAAIYLGVRLRAGAPTTTG